MTNTTTTPTRDRRAPLTIRVAATLLALLALWHGAGVTFFTLVATADPFGPVLGFTAVAVAGAVTALAAVPGLLRGNRAAWLVALCWAIAFGYWTAYKIPVEDEPEGLVLLAVDLLLLGMLLAPTTRRHNTLRS
ncbi:MAG TPA: hypothetical protein VM367_16645 [Pseudonocardia sp.]|jgi:hypothetical protein|nr:hypothetical protein [Pseudonocardia sp.]